MRIFLLILFTISFIPFRTIYGQGVSGDINTGIEIYVNELKNKNIDTVCIYSDYCAGCIDTSKKEDRACEFEGLFVSTYIFWLDKGKTFMAKKDNCFNYSAIEIPTDSIWTFCFENQDSINQEKLKPVQNIELKNGEPVMAFSSIDHSRHEIINIIIGNDTVINKDLNDYNFAEYTGFIQQKDRNINYNYNINSRIKELQLLIERIIRRTTKANPLTKTRRQIR